MPSRTPLFLLDLVLFPGELLPLHVFEPRYRQLLADCMESDHRFGVAVAALPGAIGCVARIRGAEPLADGRSNIVVLGERRFTIRRVLDEGMPYPVAAIEEFADDPESAPLPDEQTELRRLGTELRLALGILADQPGEEPTWAEDGEALSFQIASLAEMDLETRGRLLAGRSTRARARALIELLPPLVAEVRLRVEAHIRARSNGKGHRDHDIVVG